MGFPNLAEEIGLRGKLHPLNRWLITRSYIVPYAPSQADVACFKAIDAVPDASLHPHAARWYRHMTSYETEFADLPGDSSKLYKEYGPEESVSSTKLDVADENDEDVDLFGSDEEEDPETVRIREQRLADYKERKAAKPKTTAKSLVTIDVKPWDDETDMEALQVAVRGIEKDGLVWGTSKLVSVGYGIKKLQINLIVEDDKVSTQDLQDEIEAFEDFVQSSDIVVFQKL
ncbi:Translation elongation factor EF1B/ribosomal protein S6 [Cordyceps fumosorosea ARSEF 2679]|uniref:Translation elongation factor EF1B/ribosomal protein S6 n=1 Tax=Cordyceps fumosorosea (strain ARSEF 2679) TaxID=1081104 RepID=A0A167LUM0_CORFA|nr:Translation elongation factor EF1B/ribosomal protein S6 [Cordyceps fumosorosea ARSEF 2679]OAA53524.1 Translation elongation factor EF1B/ribosomal protein S6 [Cordyceps fumosorosea ARSEF 2679]